ncbi:DHH family phosphoesterase [Erysipelothrix rhusiopathiae]|nr:DHH family phosphoesterase [Erysipelothrix rhusiopathiae]
MSNQFETLKTRLMILTLTQLVVLFFFHVFINKYLYVVQYIFLVIDSAMIFYIFATAITSRKERVISVADVLGQEASYAFEYANMGIITLDDQNTITWMSELFDELNILGTGELVTDIFPAIVKIIKGNNETMKIRFDSHVFEASTMGQKNIIFFKDVTELNELEIVNRNNQVVLGIAHLDNYEETTQYEEEQTIAFIDSNIRQAVVRWADNHEMFVRRIRPDRYLLVLNEQVFQRLESERFSIVNEIRKQATKIDASITLSLAFARHSDNFKDLEDMSNKALEMAQSRGGDQVAINTKNEVMRYFGGNTEAVEKRSKVRVRVMAQNLGEHILESSNVVIVGHRMMDFDCFGSALGVSSIVSVYNKEASIVIDLEDTEVNLAGGIRKHRDEFEKDHNLVTHEQARSLIGSNTLLIMVDHHSLQQCQFPDLVDKAETIVVIDHHRRTGDFKFKPTLTYIESSASSASELIVELFPYHRRNVVISKLEATFMYTGMLIDTNRFRNRSGSRTFQAAAELRKYGADLMEVENMLRDEYESFEMKNKVLSKCEFFDDYYVIAAYKDELLPRPLMSQAADEILTVKEVEASFVVAYVDEDIVAISSRSKGELNVQVVMERLGGGGHFTGAAAQIKGQSINEVVESLKKAIENVREESE